MRLHSSHMVIYKYILLLYKHICNFSLESHKHMCAVTPFLFFMLFFALDMNRKSKEGVKHKRRKHKAVGDCLWLLFCLMDMGTIEGSFFISPAPTCPGE